MAIKPLMRARTFLLLRSTHQKRKKERNKKIGDGKIDPNIFFYIGNEFWQAEELDLLLFSLSLFPLYARMASGGGDGGGNGSSSASLSKRLTIAFIGAKSVGKTSIIRVSSLKQAMRTYSASKLTDDALLQSFYLITST